MKRLIQRFYFLQKYIDRWWFGPLIAFCAAIDHYILFFPIDGMHVTSVLLHPKKWITLSFWVTLGSWFGAALLAWLVQFMGVALLQAHWPGMMQTSTWLWAQDFFMNHGRWLIFVMGLLPVPQQPPMIISALARIPVFEIASILLLARSLKYFALGWVAAKAPDRIQKLWGVRRELKELEVELSILPKSSKKSDA
jgi:membrane protein YqaA with SNARE-associated domain